MNVSLELYRIFDAAARTRSFSEAARELYISQSAVSQAIRQLENAAGTRLFIRSGRGAELTAEGRLLSGYISSALALIAQGENRVLEVRELSAGELRIGAGDTAARWFLLPAIQRFHELYPNIVLKMTNRTSTETLALLRAGQIDVGFVNLPLEAEGITFESCMDIHDVFVAGDKFERLKGRIIGPAELASYPLIMLERRSNSRSYVDKYFMSRGVILQPQLELGAHHLLLDYAEIGLGIACVIREFSGHALGRGGMFELEQDEPVPGRAIGACWLDQLGLSPAAQRFVEIVKSREAAGVA
ncbi:MAG: LysR family transcriptional regulator [Oscillospiraceae bacterium]|nr:LysR family transcriptional regulator [Oscillospiraceae bacterium]